MQEELIEMLDKMVKYFDEIPSDSYYYRETAAILNEAEKLVEKARNSVKEPAVPQGWKLVPVEPTDDEIRRAVNLPFVEDGSGTEWVMLTPKTLARAVRRVLAAAPSQEPVKRPQNCGTSFCSCIECVCEPEPVTLTDERLREIDDAHNWQTTEGRMAAYRAIIAALREKEQAR